jgi:hypothetical protein
VPENDQKGLASRFFRATNAIKRSIPGTGLGLTIVRSIVETHGGQVDLRSREGEGTTVTIRIPLLRTAEDAARNGAGQTPSGETESQGALPFRNAGARQVDSAPIAPLILFSSPQIPLTTYDQS